MLIKKKANSFNDYQCEFSFGQLVAMKNALAQSHADPVADELYAAINWFFDNIPGPGESEEDLKKEEEAAESGMASPEAAGQPTQTRADDLLPQPDEGGEAGAGAGAPEGGLEGPGEEDLGAPGGEEGGIPAGAGPTEYPNEGGGEESETDRRLPPPPAE